MSEPAGNDPPLHVDLPTDEAPRKVRRVRDSWDKVQILVQPLGGLFTAFAIALLGFKSSEFLNRRQHTLARLLADAGLLNAVEHKGNGCA